MSRRKRMLAGLDVEIRGHIEQETQINIDRGMSPEEARRAALIKFGNVALAKEDTRAVWTIAWLENLFIDLRYAARMLRKSPGFTVVAILTLALGIGANTAIFSVIDAVMLRPLPVKNPQQLVYVYNELKQKALFSRQRVPLSYPEYRDLVKQSNAFSSMVAYGTSMAPLEQRGGSQLVPARLVSGNYFAMLGVKAALGRTFTANEVKRPGGSWVAVITDSFWQRHFGGDPHVLGKTVDLNGGLFTVIGVTPPSFNGLLMVPTADIWVPLTEQTAGALMRRSLQERVNGTLWAVGRLKPRTTMAAAQAQMAVIAARLAKRYPKTDNHTLALIPASHIRALPILGLYRIFYGISLVLMFVVGLVLLIACANVAAMNLARSATRRKEIAVRLAVGAGRWRLVRQLLTESLLLTLAGAAAAVAMTAAVNRALVHAFSTLPVFSGFNLEPGLRVDYRVLLFTLAVVALTTVLFGLSPALEASHTSPASALKEEGWSGAGGSKHRLLNGLVVAQVAFSLLLLICAGLSLRSFFNAYRMDPGFDPHGVVTAQFLPQFIGYKPAQGKAFYDQLMRRVKSLPGVVSAGYASYLPLTLSSSGTTGVLPADKAASLPQKQWPQAYSSLVGPGYFSTVQIPLLRGRTFNEQDTATAPHVVIVNQAFAQHFWPNQNPIGKHIRTGMGNRDDYEVIGVVPTGKYFTLGESPRPFFYLCILQFNDLRSVLVARTAGSPAALIAAIRKVAGQIGPKVPVLHLETMAQDTSTVLLPQSLGADIFGLAGLLALGLSCVGIYGVISYSVNQRTQEIGLRVALGARRGDVARLILRRSLGLTLLGVGIGLAGAFAATRFLSSILFGISATDPATFIGVPALLVLVALLACWIPARRAMSVDPVTALKCE